MKKGMRKGWLVVDGFYKRVRRGRGGLWCISGTTQIAIQLATGVATGVEQTTMVALS